MSRWERWTTKPNTGLSLNKFMAEAPVMSKGQEEAERLGLQFAGFGWYNDPKTGRRVARLVGDELIQYDQAQQSGAFGTTAATTDTGNPTGAGYMGPADRAKQMGLQSDGSGGYVDPNTGEVVARTVNNELVFYSPMGGAVSDGAGGEQLTQPSPSWVDPVTGELMIPPAQPESPEEKAAVPDAVPALAPVSYNGFMNFKRKEIYKTNADETAQRAASDEADADISQQQEKIDQIFQSSPGLSALKSKLQPMIEKGLESGDPHRIGRAAALMGIMEEGAEEMWEMFEGVGPENQDKLMERLVKKLMGDAQEQYFDSAIAPQYDPGSAELAKARKTPSMGGSKNFKKDYMFDDFVQNMKDEKEGLKQAELHPKQPGRISGGRVFYDVSNTAPSVGQDSVYQDDLDAAMDEVHREADKVGRQYGMKNPRAFQEISWETKGGKEANPTERAKKITALDAVKTWRTKVLPKLTPGTIVWNDPVQGGRGDNVRERIYSLAGFGDYAEENFGQYALVVKDDKGNNKLVPIEPGTEGRGQARARALRAEEFFLEAACYATTEDQINKLYQILF